jgi:hypothetical protein
MQEARTQNRLRINLDRSCIHIGNTYCLPGEEITVQVDTKADKIIGREEMAFTAIDSLRISGSGDAKPQLFIFLSLKP